MRALARPVWATPISWRHYRERAEQVRRAARPRLPDADAPDIQIEDFDCAENLMIEAAIVASGGSRFVRGWSIQDLRCATCLGFEACLVQARALINR